GGGPPGLSAERQHAARRQLELQQLRWVQRLRAQPVPAIQQRRCQVIDDRGFSEHALLDHYERAHCSRQWSAFIGVLMDELFRSAGEHEARSFLRHIGRRLAQAFELGRHDTLQSLEAAMNGYWGALDWGYVELAER